MLWLRTGAHVHSFELAVPRDRLFGRARELAEIERRLHDGARLVTITGGPGIGKTRLARELLARDPSVGPAISLAAASSDGIASAIAARLGRIEIGPSDPIESLSSALARRGPMVLVLDRLEHVIDRAGDVIGRMLDRAPDCRFVVTSRARLAIDGEVVVELAPLSFEGDDSDALALFVDRADRGGGRFTGDDRPTLLALVRRLRGNPLAIELAAARTRLFDVRTLLARLESSYSLLDDGASAGLSAAIRSSWDLLDPFEQRVLADCAVFAGGFDVEAAEAMAPDRAEEVVAALQSLRDQSLLACDADGRLSMFDAVAELAGAALVDRDRSNRHRDHFLAASERWIAGAERGDRDARARLRRDRANVVAAIERAVHDRLDDESLRRASLAIGFLGSTCWSTARVVELATVALENSEQGTGTGYALLERAWAHRQLGALDLARDDLDRVLSIARDRGDDRLLGRALSERGAIHSYRFELAEAIGFFERALAVQRAIGDRCWEAKTVAAFGGIAFREGRLSEARRAFRRAARLARATGDEVREPWYVANEGLACLEDGRPNDAERCFVEARELAERAENAGVAALALGYLGLTRRSVRDFAGARDRLERGSIEATAAGLVREAAQMAGALGECCREAGDLASAEGHFERAVELLGDVGDEATKALALASLAATVARSGRVPEAESIWEEAQRARVGSPGLHAAVRIEGGHFELARARAAAAAGDHERAAESFAVACTIVRELRSSGGPRHMQAALSLESLVASLAELDGEAALAREVHVRNDSIEIGTRAIALARRPVLKKLVLALARASERGEAVGIDELIEAVWPGERMRLESARNRLHVALHQLRKLGLRELVVSSEAGYRFDPRLSVVVDDGRSVSERVVKRASI
jgi:predicted ATPase